MPLSDEQELDQKWLMVSPVAVQRSTVSHPLKRLFETLTKSEEETSSYGAATVKRQRLFRTFSKSANSCPPVSTELSWPSQISPNGAYSEGD